MSDAPENAVRQPEEDARDSRPPHEEHQSRRVAGLLFILAGLAFLAVQWAPGFRGWLPYGVGWPLAVVGFGLFLALVGLVSGDHRLIAPASFFVGLGALLYWQNGTGNWQSWAYTWTLFPVFSGVGRTLVGLGRGDGMQTVGGLGEILTGLVLFAIFSSFFGGPSWLLGRWWPAGVVLLGLWLIFVPRSWRRHRRRE